MRDLVPDDSWARIAPILPPPPQRRNQHPGRRRTDDRTALAGILFVLRTGAAWRDVPRQETGCSGVTPWRRLRDWIEAGVWPRLHAAILAELRKAGLLEMDDCAIDGSHVRSPKGGAHTGPSPVDRGRPGSKHHIVVDRRGTPLAVSLTGGNRHTMSLSSSRSSVPSHRIRGLRGRPRHRPQRLYADRGYDFDKYRRPLRRRGIAPKIARRGAPHGSGLGKARWVVERTFAWLHQFKRLRIRYEMRADLYLGLLQLARGITCLGNLRAAF
ncbi:IS5 family transposase [Streptomyces sp. NPDC058542]|uniref:IS5 family transposase n=1 Tax=Streptomyces sp. NPDC058542 TaxID=3346543 RepID=UPI003653E38A